MILTSYANVYIICTLGRMQKCIPYTHNQVAEIQQYCPDALEDLLQTV